MPLKGALHEKGISLETENLMSTRNCTSTGNEPMVFPLLLNRVSLPAIYFLVPSSGKMPINLKTGDMQWIRGFGLFSSVYVESDHDYFLFTLYDSLLIV